MNIKLEQQIVGNFGITVQVDSTGMMGGDAGHGGRTEIVVNATEVSGLKFQAGTHGLVIIAEGDWELAEIAKTFKIITKALKLAVKP